MKSLVVTFGKLPLVGCESTLNCNVDTIIVSVVKLVLAFPEIAKYFCKFLFQS